MANIKKTKGVIGILTGGGDVPGLNPAIRAVTIRALREGYKVIGIRRGWAGAIGMSEWSEYEIPAFSTLSNIVCVDAIYVEGRYPSPIFCLGTISYHTRYFS